MSRSGFDGCRAFWREGGQGLSRFFAETKFAEGALLDEFGRRKELTVVWLGMIILSPICVVQDCLKSGSGTVKSILVERRLRLTINWNPNSGE